MHSRITSCGGCGKKWSIPIGEKEIRICGECLTINTVAKGIHKRLWLNEMSEEAQKALREFHWSCIEQQNTKRDLL